MTKATMDETHSELKYMDVEKAMLEVEADAKRMKWISNVGLVGLFIAGMGAGAALAGPLLPPDIMVVTGALTWTVGLGMMVYSIWSY